MNNRIRIKIKEPTFSQTLEEYKKRVSFKNSQELQYRTGTDFLSSEVIKKLPQDVQVTCKEINSNYQNSNPISCFLLLRRVVPMSIIRKFQHIEEEQKIINNDGDFLDTKDLINKVETEKIIYGSHRAIRDLKKHKKLLDSAQHIFATKFTMEDVESVKNDIRVFLEALFDIQE